MKIGVFDSGLGGLTVLKALWQSFPQADYIYLGDTARVPYGIRSRDVIIRYARESLQFLQSQSIELCVVACNTVSAYALETLAAEFPFPIIGVVEPGVRAAIAAKPSHAVGVIGTEATIRSRAYESRLQDALPHLEILSQPCPLFVPLVEEGWLAHPVTESVIATYINHFRERHIDVLVLGCTHYPLLKPLIQKVVGEDVLLIDSAEEIAHDVARRFNLSSRAQRGDLPKSKGTTSFFVTDQADRFDKLSSLILNKPYSPVQQVVL